MSQASSSFVDQPESFRLHYVRGTQRCVVAYDTLEGALEGAFKRLEKNRQLELWISDAGKRVLLDTNQIRTRFDQRDRGGPAEG